MLSSRIRGVFETVVLWLLVPGIGLAGTVSVMASAASFAVQERSTAPEVPEGFVSYSVTIAFVYIVFVSMTINAVLIFRRADRPLRRLPLPIALAQCGLYATLALWLVPLRLEFLDIPVGVVLGSIGVIAPLACMFFSVFVFAQVIRRTRYVPAARVALRWSHVALAVIVVLAGATTLVVRWAVALNPTGENAANWALVTVGAPWSVPASALAWIIEPILATPIHPSEARKLAVDIASRVTLSLPVLLNIGLAIAAMFSSRLRRLAP